MTTNFIMLTVSPSTEQIIMIYTDTPPSLVSVLAYKLTRFALSLGLNDFTNNSQLVLCLLLAS